MAKALPPVPQNVTIDQYPVLTTLSIFPNQSLDGNITLKMEDSITAPQVLNMKIYNVVYHLLRACNPFPVPSPTNTRQGARRFEHLASILHVLSTNQQSIGWICVELRVCHTPTLRMQLPSSWDQTHSFRSSTVWKPNTTQPPSPCTSERQQEFLARPGRYLPAMV